MATSKAIPFVWSYSDIEPLLQRAAELVTMDDSERRSLILVNPGLAPKRASVSTMSVVSQTRFASSTPYNANPLSTSRIACLSVSDVGCKAGKH